MSHYCYTFYYSSETNIFNGIYSFNSYHGIKINLERCYQMQKIVVVGGGAGGLELVTKLGDKLGRKKNVQVTLIDQNSTHLWKPLLHEIATGVLDDQTDHISYHAQALNHHFSFQQATLLDIDRDNKCIVVSDANRVALGDENSTITIAYDVLVIAIGSVSNDFGTPGIKEHAVFLDDQNSAIALRDQLLSTFLRFDLEPAKKQDNVKIAIVGGGATGVELAAELPYMVEKLNKNGYQKLNKQMLDITIVEAADHILPALPIKLSNSITEFLGDIGITVKTKTMITHADNLGLYPKEGELIAADIMVWAAGVKAPNFLNNIAGLESNRNNQLVIKSTLQTTRDDTIFVIGDSSSYQQANGQFVSPTAQAAHQMVSVCAYNIEKFMNDLPMKNFKYSDKGTMIALHHSAQGVISTIGESKLTVKGFIAVSVHKLVYRMHLMSLLGLVDTFRFVRATSFIKRTKSMLSRKK